MLLGSRGCLFVLLLSLTLMATPAVAQTGESGQVTIDIGPAANWHAILLDRFLPVDQPINGQTVSVIGGVSVLVGPFAGLRLELEPPSTVDFLTGGKGVEVQGSLRETTISALVFVRVKRAGEVLFGPSFFPQETTYQEAFECFGCVPRFSFLGKNLLTDTRVVNAVTVGWGFPITLASRLSLVPQVRHYFGQGSRSNVAVTARVRLN